MKDRVEFKYYTTATDAMGGTAATYSTLDTVWAEVTPVNGREAYEMEGIRAQEDMKIKTRYRDDLVSLGYSSATYDSSLLAVYGGENYNVKYVSDEGAEKSYVIMYAVKERGDG